MSRRVQVGCASGKSTCAFPGREFTIPCSVTPYEAACQELLTKHPRLQLMWSGGIDTTAILTAFMRIDMMAYGSHAQPRRAQKRVETSHILNDWNQDDNLPPGPPGAVEGWTCLGLE
eukprot:970729-Amphidinium_carterae.1